jgi:hypothetical protein
MGKPDFTDLLAEDPKIKYSCAKNILAFARENPAGVYPDLKFFAKLLDSENKILKWTAIDIMWALAKVDDLKTIDRLIESLFGLLHTGNMITANHAINALADIASAKPEYQEEITKELLKVERYSYDMAECRNICIGKVILAIDRYFGEMEDKEATLEFVKRQTKNTRNATGKKAEKFLTKYMREN